MNGTFTKDSGEESISGDEAGSPTGELDFRSGGSDEDVESGNLPSESASLGSPAERSRKTAPRAKVGAAKSQPVRKPPFVDMVIEAILEIADKKGASVKAIRTHIQGKYAIADATMKTNYKKAVLKALDSDMLFRPGASKDSKGLTGRFKVSPEYLKKKLKEEKLKEKAKKKTEANAAKKKLAAKKVAAAKTKKPAKKATVNGKELKSLGEKSLAVKVAKEKIKNARKSIGLTPTAKPRAAPRKKPLKKAQKLDSKSSKGASKTAKAKPAAAKSGAKGKAKGAAKKPAAAAATKKTTKAKK